MKNPFKNFKVDETNIGKINLFYTIFFVLLFVFVLIYSSSISKKSSNDKLKIELQSKFIENKKDEIRRRVLSTNELLLNSSKNLNLTKEQRKSFVLERIKELNKKYPRDYFFVFDLVKDKEGKYFEKVLIHPNVPVGKIIDLNRIDLNGNKFVEDFQTRVLTSGSTFLDYSYIHPKTKKEEYKSAFFMLNEFNWVVGSGFFITDIKKDLEKIDEEIEKRMYKEIKQYLAITIFFFLILIFFILKINGFTARIIDKFKLQVEEKKKKLEASKDYLTKYTKIIEKSTIVSKTDSTGIITYVSEGFCELTGYKEEELVGKSFEILNHPDTNKKLFEQMWETVNEKKSFKTEIRNLTKENRVLHFLLIVTPILDEKMENIIEFISYRFDITKEFELQEKLKKQNIELKKSEKVLNEAQRIAHIGNWEHNCETDTLTLSTEAKRIFGFDESIHDMPFGEFKKVILDEDLEKVKDVTSLPVDMDNQFFIEHRIKRANNKIGYVEVKGEYFYSKDGIALKSRGIVKDVTQRKISEHELKQKDIMLLQQSKMAAMGEMISNIAHQWRQPLSLISTAATGAKLQKEIGVLTDEKLEETLVSINNSVQYLSKTIDDFRNFFRPDNEKTKFKVSHLLQKATSLVKPQFKNRDIKIIEELDDFELFALENELLQVLINILNNARDQLMKVDNKKLIFIKAYQNTNRNIITIQDSGNGIDEDIINRIFEPYFTTKHSSEGTGIGLYMSEEIITKHMMGQIHAENSSFIYEEIEYKGAKFIISLPNGDKTSNKETE